MRKLLQRFWKDEQGLELSEYAVMVALIIIAVIVAITALSTAISGKFNEVAGIIGGTGGTP